MSSIDPELGHVVGPQSDGQPDQQHIHHFANVVHVVILARNWLTNAQNRQKNREQQEKEEEKERERAAVFEVPTNLSQDTNNHIGNGATNHNTKANNNIANGTSHSHKNHANSVSTPEVVRVSCCDRMSSLVRTTLTGIKNGWKSAVDPHKTFFYYWTFLVYLAFLYNCIMCVMFVFDDTQGTFFFYWLNFNFISDFINLIDVFINLKLIRVEDGIRMTNTQRLIRKNAKTLKFTYDVISLLPTDIVLALVDTKYSICRTNRLFKMHRALDFVERTSVRTNYPNGFRIFHIVITCMVIFHLNAALYFKISLYTGIHSINFGAWEFNYVKNQDVYFASCDMLDTDIQCGVPELDADIDYRQDVLLKFVLYWEKRKETYNFSSFAKQYSLSIYWSSLTLTTSGQQPFPTATAHNLLEIVDTIIGVLVFAVIVGSVGNVVVTMNKSRAEYQNLMDGIKFYMTYRKVSHEIQQRVMDCISYIQKNSSFQNEDDIMDCVPNRLQGELAVHLHMSTLKTVELLKDSEPSLMYEFVLRLSMQMFGPNDYLCRIGDVAKEMYIVKEGTLEKISSTGNIIDILKEGDVFGELSLLKVSKQAKYNRRRVSLRSVGYTDVYRLRQEDVAEILKDYPEAREELIKKARTLIDDEMNTMKHNRRKLTKEATHGLQNSECGLDESLTQLDEAIKKIDQDLKHLFDQFEAMASENKKRVTRLEAKYQKHSNNKT